MTQISWMAVGLLVVPLALGLVAPGARAADLPDSARPQGMTYADGRLWHTFVTVTFDATGVPPQSLDKLYTLGNGLISVSDTAPGTGGYNGARWVVQKVAWNTAPRQVVSEAEVLAAAAAGDLTITPTTMGIQCPLVAPL